MRLLLTAILAGIALGTVPFTVKVLTTPSQKPMTVIMIVPVKPESASKSEVEVML